MAKQTILIADDEKLDRELLSYMLEDEYEIILADGGQKCLDLAFSEAPDLILLDVMMPGIDGFEACRQLKANAKTAQTPVIFISAIDPFAHKYKSTEQLADYFIIKPFEADTLFRAISLLLWSYDEPVV